MAILRIVSLKGSRVHNLKRPPRQIFVVTDRIAKEGHLLERFVEPGESSAFVHGEFGGEGRQAFVAECYGIERELHVSRAR